MQQIISEESEMDFKEPLSPTPQRTCSRMSSTHSLPPPPKIITPTLTPPSYGLMGDVGIVVGIVIFLLELASDALLAYALWEQYDTEPHFYRRQEERSRFLITLAIIIVPTLVINMLSLIWYTQNKSVLGGEGEVFKMKSPVQKGTCVVGHVLMVAPLVRYLDILRMGKKRHPRYRMSVEMGSRASVHRYDSKEEGDTVLQVRTLSRDTAMLDLMHTFFQSVPQLLFQIFLIYRTQPLIQARVDQFSLTLPTQLLKIMIGVLAISWSLVTYQDELRRATGGRRQLTCGATTICLFWRSCMVGARIISIASLAALKVDGEGGLIKLHSNSQRGSFLSFPMITTFILLGHWFLMVIWIHAQKTTYCTTERGHRLILEFIYDLFMSWVHVFCYVNMKDTPSRRKIFFFYALILIENTGFMFIWYMQLITKDIWLRVTIVFSVEALFVIGLSCAIGYYAFLHPHKEQLRENDPSWQR